MHTIDKDLIKNFNVRLWLEESQIRYINSGKNVSTEWIGLSCPFCQDDPSYHLGIHVESNSINCWRCNTKGTILKLILKLKRVSVKSAINILNEYQFVSFKSILSKPDKILTSSSVLPVEAKEKFYQIHIDYLKNRNFNPDEIIYKYKLKACYNIGRIQFKYRIFIPIIINNQTVCYTARDVTNSREPRYLNCPNQNAITPIKNCLYNIDTVADKMIIVEGPFDVLRIGDGCVATFGTEFTEKQIKTIAELKLKKITIIFDIDAQKQAVNLRKYLYSFCNDVEIFKINVKDPAELNINSVGEIRKRFL